MPQIIMKTSLAGPNVSKAPGEMYECDEAEAKRFVDKDLAEWPPETPADKPAKAESATIEHKPRRRGRPRKTDGAQTRDNAGNGAG